MRTPNLLARFGAWTVVVIGTLVALAVMFSLHDHYGFGWAFLAFLGVLAPCVGVARILSRYVQRREAVAHGPPRTAGEPRYCARCGLETRTADPTCTFCGGSRFVADPPQIGRSAPS